MKYLILTLLTFFTVSTYASSLSIDIGSTKTLYNRFAIPGTDKDRVTLPKGDALTSYRLTGYFDLKSKNQIYFLLAPLETESTFISSKNFEFDKTTFSANTETRVNYKFNSYRLGYLWKWYSSNLKYWTGVVGKIRDAKISVSQGATTKSYDNFGFVPLLAFGFDYQFSPSFSIFSHTDALSASQGSAFDSQLEFRYLLRSFGVSLGKRIFGGGADNDEVYTFAQFDTYYLRLSYFF